MLKQTIVGFLAFISTVAFGQIEPNNGVPNSKVEMYALKNATIMVSPEKTIEQGTLLIQGDEIIKIGTLLKIPSNAVVIDCEGKTIIPSFIELSSSVGIPEAKSTKTGYYPQLNSYKKGAYYWNESIHPEVDANQLYSSDSKGNTSLVQKGFGFALTHQKDGIMQGKGAFVALGATDIHKQLTDWSNAQFYSFQKGKSQQSYPSSQMGSIALLRQALYDAQWYQNASEKERNLSLEAIIAAMESTHIFYTTDKWEILRSAKIAHEFNLNFNYVGSGNEYQIADEIADEIAELNSTVILPINFPKAYDVTNPYVARQIPLSDLKHWEMAPHNPRILREKGINLCITSEGHKTAKDFWEHVRQMINFGLSQSDALNALTLEPAKTIGADEHIGSLDVGKKASLMIYDTNPFEDKAMLLESWSLGERKVHKEVVKHKIAGKYNLIIGNRQLPLTITGEGAKLSGNIALIAEKFIDGVSKSDTTKIKTKIILDGNDITLQFAIQDSIWNGSTNLRGKVNSNVGLMEGEGMIPTGEWVKWSAIKTEKAKSKKKKKKVTTPVDSMAVSWFPNMAYGFDSIPESQLLVIEHATVWTNEEDGIIENGTVILKDGKIIRCGKGKFSKPKGAIVIDGTGFHVTSGIIDEHSHIAISKGVNEGGQAISAEVSIGDVVHSDDINIYRQLAGGVTAAQLLHGSANPIGGQSALIKLKWGYTPEEMLIDNAPKFIKFALGENIKQSNWGDFNRVRFPQTRMGVEQVYYDGFERAKAYRKAKDDFKNGIIDEAPRVDLELEVLIEILESERFVSCHSYIQSEINMLMHVADSMGFRLNTFTHILEGYKLADKMAAHGAGASTFADWWAYKFEVNDAIPYNAKIMTDQGIVVAINSDDAEMGRRLNQEAAKTVKYGGMTEEEAWKTVTLNPAKLLHLDDRMGSLKEDKDADIVIWSANPLSIQAKVLYTIVDGVILYERETSNELRERNQREKARIIAKMLDSNALGKKRVFVKKKKGHFHCNTLGEEESLEQNHH